MILFIFLEECVYNSKKTKWITYQLYLSITPQHINIEETLDRKYRRAIVCISIIHFNTIIAIDHVRKSEVRQS